MIPLGLLLLKLIVLFSLAVFVGRCLLIRSACGPRILPTGPLFYTAALLLSLFALALGYQTHWQLNADQDPNFAKVEKLDPRPWERERLIRRGEVLDRRGEKLIENRERDGQAQRFYPGRETTAHLTGYLHRLYGRTGLEAACDDRLLAWRRTVVDQVREQVETTFRKGPARPRDVRLTIDLRLQRAAAHGLSGRRGAVVALSPRTGDVLVLYSSPGFDPNRIAPDYFQKLREDAQRPFINRAIQGLYPPGSVFKLITASAALDQGFPVTWSYDCPAAGYRPPGDETPIQDHEVGYYARLGQTWAGHGRIDLRRAMLKSANTYFAQLGVDLGADLLLDYARRFGFETTTTLISGLGSDLALQVKPSQLPTDLELPPHRAARLAIGQDQILVTPFQMALVTAAIANGGVLLRPRLLLDDPVQAGTEILPPAVAKEVAKMMRDVVAAPGGTGAAARLPNLAVAGKTGSAENPHGAPHAWFVCFAPYEEPRLVVVVIVENGGTGGGVAAPVAAHLLRVAQAAGYFEREAKERNEGEPGGSGARIGEGSSPNRRKSGGIPRKRAKKIQENPGGKKESRGE